MGFKNIQERKRKRHENGNNERNYSDNEHAAILQSVIMTDTDTILLQYPAVNVAGKTCTKLAKQTMIVFLPGGAFRSVPAAGYLYIF